MKNKTHLIAFLNTLLPKKHHIQTLQHYSKSEHLNSTPVDHKAIFDLRCVGQSGEHFIVEPNQNSLKFYATFPIQQQAQADE